MIKFKFAFGGEMYPVVSLEWYKKKGTLRRVQVWVKSRGVVTYEASQGTLLQYTGYKDRDGAEIYDGDILFYGDEGPWVIEWEDPNGRWVIDYKGEDKDIDCFEEYPNETRRTGNIHTEPNNEND